MVNERASPARSAVRRVAAPAGEARDGADYGGSAVNKTNAPPNADEMNAAEVKCTVTVIRMMQAINATRPSRQMGFVGVNYEVSIPQRTDMLVVRPCPMYLYLTTTGRVTGQPREIEIWFTEHDGRFYLVAEQESANWVRDIQSQPQVKARVGDAEFNAIARVVQNDREPQLVATVKALFDAKYGWSDGLIVELTPA
jgi:deazaflavin-dependent oxidoreductase (nitroreductase family)